MAKRNENQNDDNKMEERVLTIRRVSKKTTGGNYVSFSALVAVGDGEGNVGVGLGRGQEVPPAIQKAITKAKKNMVHLPIYNDTLPHEVVMKYKSSRLLLKPAPPGTGLKLGGVVRAVLDIAGVNNASGKIIGSRNQITNAYAVIEAIKMLKPRIVISKESNQNEQEIKGSNVGDAYMRPVQDKGLLRPVQDKGLLRPVQDKDLLHPVQDKAKKEAPVAESKPKAKAVKKAAPKKEVVAAVAKTPAKKKTVTSKKKTT